MIPHTPGIIPECIARSTAGYDHPPKNQTICSPKGNFKVLIESIHLFISNQYSSLGQFNTFYLFIPQIFY